MVSWTETAQCKGKDQTGNHLTSGVDLLIRFQVLCPGCGPQTSNLVIAPLTLDLVSAALKTCDSAVACRTNSIDNNIGRTPATSLRTHTNYHLRCSAARFDCKNAHQYEADIVLVAATKLSTLLISNESEPLEVIADHVILVTFPNTALA